MDAEFVAGVSVDVDFDFGVDVGVAVDVYFDVDVDVVDDVLVAVVVAIGFLAVDFSCHVKFVLACRSYVRSANQLCVSVVSNDTRATQCHPWKPFCLLCCRQQAMHYNLTCHNLRYDCESLPGACLWTSSTRIAEMVMKWFLSQRLLKIWCQQLLPVAPPLRCCNGPLASELFIWFLCQWGPLSLLHVEDDAGFLAAVCKLAAWRNLKIFPCFSTRTSWRQIHSVADGSHRWNVSGLPTMLTVTRAGFAQTCEHDALFSLVPPSTSRTPFKQRFHWTKQKK